MREDNIKPVYWMLWAQSRRANLSQLTRGYPRQVPWYQPPVLGELYSHEPGEVDYITEDDVSVIVAIDEALALHVRRRPAEVQALEIWEGAYADALPDRDARVAQWEMPRSAIQKGARRAKLAVERYLYTGA